MDVFLGAFDLTSTHVRARTPTLLRNDLNTLRYSVEIKALKYRNSHDGDTFNQLDLLLLSVLVGHYLLVSTLPHVSQLLPSPFGYPLIWWYFHEFDGVAVAVAVAAASASPSLTPPF